MRRFPVGLRAALFGALVFASASSAISPVPFLMGGATAGAIAGSAGVAFQNIFTNGTLISQVGPVLTSTRATTSYTRDFENLLKPILVNEARFVGLRRVENLHSVTSQNFAHASWTKTTATLTSGIADHLGGSSAFTFTTNGVNSQVFEAIAVSAVSQAYRGAIWIRRRTGSGAVNLITIAGGRQAVTLTTSWQRFSQGETTATTIYYGVELATSGDAVDMAFSQIENVTGQAITAPSEYVSKGVLSSPWHGAGADGTKYFNTQNGNTVASNVVTEAPGTAINTVTTKAGIDPFGAATNVALQSENFGTAPWTVIGTPTRVAANHTTTGVTLDLLGDDDGLALEGYTQTVTFTGDGTKAVSIFMKAGTSIETVIRLRDVTPVAADRLLAGIAWSGGVPTVTMTTGTHEATSPDSYADGVYRFRFVTTAVTAANTNNLEVYPASSTALLGTRTGTVNVGGAMVQNAASANFPYIKTTTVAATTNADSITADGASVINQTEGTLYVKAYGPVSGDVSYFGLDNGTTAERALLGVSGNASFILVEDGAVSQAFVTSGTRTVGGTEKLAGRYRLNDTNVARNGTAGTTDTTCTMPTTTTIRLGDAGGALPNTTIVEVEYHRRAFTDAELVTKTTP